MSSSHPDLINERLRGCGILPTAQRVRIAGLLLAAPSRHAGDSGGVISGRGVAPS